jgi:hypothetical protein
MSTSRSPSAVRAGSELVRIAFNSLTSVIVQSRSVYVKYDLCFTSLSSCADIVMKEVVTMAEREENFTISYLEDHRKIT